MAQFSKEADEGVQLSANAAGGAITSGELKSLNDSRCIRIGSTSVQLVRRYQINVIVKYTYTCLKMKRKQLLFTIKQFT